MPANTRSYGSGLTAYVLLAITVAGCSSKTGEASARLAAARSLTESISVQVGPVGSPDRKDAAKVAVGGGPVALSMAFGLTHLVATPLERVPVRWPQGTVTTSAWRLEIICDQGRGGIVLDELSSRESYAGDGIFHGWPSAQLAGVYRTLAASLGSDAPPTELPLLN
jgi:hypothetical protein